EPDGLLELEVIVELDIRKNPVPGGFALFKVAEHRRHAPMVRVLQQVAGEVLYRGRLTLAGLHASVFDLLLERIAERRRTEPLTDIAHELDDSGAELAAVALGAGDAAHELLQVVADVPFP